jgi:hypothetical protein
MRKGKGIGKHLPNQIRLADAPPPIDGNKLGLAFLQIPFQIADFGSPSDKLHINSYFLGCIIS